MNRLKAVILCLGLIAADIGKVSSLEQSFAIEPKDQSVVVNTVTTLPCRVFDLAGQLQWTKDDFALGTNRNLSYHGYPRYTMIGSDSIGEYNLKLDPVTLDDDGVYQCQVGTGKRDEPAIRSQKATLTVLVPPDRPRIVQGEIVYTTEKIPLELECVSEGGKPPAELTWVDGSGNAITDGVKTFIEAMPADNRRFVTRSVLKIVPKMEHHNTTIRCQAHNTASDKKLQAKVKMNVKFGPKINLEIAGPVRKLVEGMDVQFLCVTKANPPDVTYKWFVNDQVALSEGTSEMWVTNISRHLHNSHVRCEAENSVDKAEVSKVLSILYQPVFKTRPRSLQADPGSTLTISCEVDSNPPAAIEWTNKRTKKVVSTTSNLTLQDINAAKAGQYHCKATAKGFPELNADATIILRSAPVISSPSIQYSQPAQTARLECVAKSVPAPDRMTWSFHGTLVGTGTDTNYFSVLEDPTEDGVKSTLIVKNIRDEQFGKYNCTASNFFGSDSIEIAMTPKNDLMMLVAIVCAGCGLVVLLIILMIAGFIQHARKKMLKKTDFGGAESDCTDNKQNAAAIRDSDVSSNVSDIKVETGTGSSLSNYRYTGGDNDSTAGGPDSTTAATDAEHRRRSASPRSEHGLPLAGPVQFDPSRPGHPDHRPISMIHHPLAENDYANPMNYVVYNNSITDRPISSSNGYIAADRLYDLNPIPQSSLTMTTSLVGTPASLVNGIPAGPRNNAGGGGGGGDPATMLQYSAAYRNPYLRQPSSAQWLAAGHNNNRRPYDGRPEPPPYGAVRTVRNAPGAAAAGAPAGPNYHMGMAKRQTLATHV